MPLEPDYFWESELVQQACRKLRELRLPIHFKQEFCSIISNVGAGIGNTFVSQILGCSAPGLVRLSLFAVDLLWLNDAGDMCIYSKGKNCLEFLVFPAELKLLQFLELQGWPLPQQSSFGSSLCKLKSSLVPRPYTHLSLTSPTISRQSRFPAFTRGPARPADASRCVARYAERRHLKELVVTGGPFAFHSLA